MKTWRAILGIGVWGLAVLLSEVGRADGPQPAIEGYRDSAAVDAEVKRLAKSKFVRQQSLGETLGGRQIHLLTLGTGRLDEKPALLIVGGVQPTRLFTSELVLGLAGALADQAESTPGIRRLLDRLTVYAIPRVTPDAAEAFFAKPREAREANLRPRDDDRDGRVDEDPSEDLNGDGLITQIRVEDPEGTYIALEDDPRVLVEAEPGREERGRYLVFPEGFDNDGDELLNEDGVGGVVFNRNFTYDYPYFGLGAGPHQVSEVETRAVADFAFSHPNIVAVLSFSSRGNLLTPWTAAEASDDPAQDGEEEPDEKGPLTQVTAEDAPYFEIFAERYRELIEADDVPEAEMGKGAFAPWAYFHYGRWSLAARGWWLPDPEEDAAAADDDEADDQEEKDDDTSADGKEDSRGADDLAALAWFGERGIDGYVAWTPIEHPDFPGQTVEVGGFKPFLRENPPAELLDRLVETHVSLVLDLLRMFPRVKIARLETEPLGGSVYRITALVANEGKLPSLAKVGEISREGYPLMAELKLPEGVTLVTGSRRRQLDRLEGGGDHVETEWIVRKATDKPVRIRVTVKSPAVGEVTKRADLSEERAE